MFLDPLLKRLKLILEVIIYFDMFGIQTNLFYSKLKIVIYDFKIDFRFIFFIQLTFPYEFSQT
jgi:hypothetical protein